MSDPFLDKFIADIVKSAGRSPFTGKAQAITVSRENRGHEEKLANHAGLGAAFLGPIGAAIGADKGQGLSAAGGSVLGGMGGSLAGLPIGALLGALAGNPAAGASIGGALGGYAGNIYGASRGGEDDSLAGQVKHKLSSHHAAGVKDAAARFGIKEAFLPMLGAIAGPMLARAGAGALARGAGGAMLGRAAGAIAPRIAGGVGGQIFDQAASMGGQALGQKLQRPQPPPMGA